MELTPSLVMAVWTAGVALGAGLVAWWNIVGPGYVWMAGGTVILFGAFAVALDAGPAAIVGIIGAVIAVVAARNRAAATGGLLVAAGAFAAIGFGLSPWLLVVSGALMVGGITSEMLLGHWFLVDPTLPKWSLRALVIAGGAGLAIEAALVSARLAGNGIVGDVVFGWAYAALAAMTGVLLVAVWFSLKEPRYTGVMAATGLSYLAVLTGLGTLVVGRMIAYV